MALFSKKEKTSCALFDIDSSSVGGALAYAEGGAPPTICYTVRKVIQPKEHEESADAMCRTLEEVSAELIQKGAPILRQETGSGNSENILVSIGAPWQKSLIRVDVVSEKKPFVFTKAILADALRRSPYLPKGYLKSNESVVATLLNGYETSEPFGKKVGRADMIILTSFLDANVSSRVEQILRKTYHTHALTLTGFAPIAYSVFRDVYPHEKDFLVVEISGEATNIIFVKHGLLVNVANVQYGLNQLIMTAKMVGNDAEAEKMWLSKIAETLGAFAANHALPRTLFLLVEPGSLDYLRSLIDSPSLRSLWLTDDPLRVVSVVPQHFANVVKVRGEAEGDVFLQLLALYRRNLA